MNETVVIGNPERHVRKASRYGSKQQQRYALNLSYYCLFTLHI